MAEPTTLLGYDDFVQEMSYHLGGGADVSLLDSEETDRIDRDVQTAYRWILYPSSLPGEGIPHTWSWLTQTKTLNAFGDASATAAAGLTTTLTATTATFSPEMVGQTIVFTASGNEYTITAYTSSTIVTVNSTAAADSSTAFTITTDGNCLLPDDFGSFIGQFMAWPAGSPYSPPYKVDPMTILQLRAQSNMSNRPQMFALRWRSQSSGANQKQELVFYPLPDADYVFTYQYAILVNKLSTTNPYPLGGARISQLMMEACKALAAKTVDGYRSDQWESFRSSLKDAIEKDKADATPPTVGFMRGTDYRSFVSSRNSSTIAYYAGPDSGGNYTLTP